MPISKSDFEKYDPNTLSGRADALKSIVDLLGQQEQAVRSATQKLDGNFSGNFADAVREQVNTDKSSLSKLHDAVDGLRGAYAGGMGKLLPPVNNVRQTLQSAQQNGFQVSDDWQLQDTQRPGMRRAGIQEQLQQRLRETVTALERADNDVMTDVQKGVQAITEVPAPQFAPSAAASPEPKPDEQKHDDPKHDDQPAAGHKVPGPDDKYDSTDEHPTMAGSEHDHPPMKVDNGSSDKVKLQDDPPGGIHSGESRDDAWKRYLSQTQPPHGVPLNPDGTARGAGDPIVLPNPEAVKDPGLKAVGAAARQQGISYAYGGGHLPGKPGPSNGTIETEDAGVFHDKQRVGYDCAGLARFATQQGAGLDISQGNEGNTVGQLRSLLSPGGHGTQVSSLSDLKPGDLIYYGPPGASHHVAVYAGNGMVVQAAHSGTPVEVTPLDKTPLGDGWTAVHVH